jgi:hypothetical protein
MKSPPVAKCKIAELADFFRLDAVPVAIGRSPSARYQTPTTVELNAIQNYPSVPSPEFALNNSQNVLKLVTVFWACLLS